MKLRRIEMTDFRSFYGEQILEFAEGDERNVTLIHAENGTGKTTILNALFWSFHGKTTGNFNSPEILVNHTAAREGKHACKVTVLFQHEQRDFELSRTYDKRQKTSILRVNEVLASGERRAHPQQTAFVQQVFPFEMAPYFFFDGEYATNFATSTSNKAVKEAIQEILGCTAAQNALFDIKTLDNKVHKLIRERTSSQEIVNLESERTKCLEFIESSDKRIEDIEAERLLKTRLNVEINDYLNKHAATKVYQRDRVEREAELKAVNGDLKREQASRRTWVAKNAALVCGETVATRCENIYRELESKAQIPAPYNEEFVRALLAGRTCICARCLEPGSPEAAAVSQLLSSATESVVQRQLVNVKGFCRRFSHRKEEAIAQLASIQRRIVDIEARRHKIQLRLDELSTLLKGLQSVDLNDREERRSENNRRLQALAVEESKIKDAKLVSVNRIKAIDDQIKARAVHDAALKNLMVRKEFLAKATRKLDESLDNLKSDALGTLRKDTNELIDRIFRDSIKVTIDDNYGLTLKTPQGDTAPPSSGQAQLVSLAFLASLIRYCAKREKDENILLQPGTVAPFVLDSPFGQLDNTYREGAAKFLPEYAKQLVLLVSSTQGNENTLRHMRKRVGSEVILIKENASPRPKSQEDVVEEVSIGGHKHVVTYWDRPIDRTRIENIAYYEDK